MGLVTGGGLPGYPIPAPRLSGTPRPKATADGGAGPSAGVTPWWLPACPRTVSPSAAIPRDNKSRRGWLALATAPSRNRDSL